MDLDVAPSLETERTARQYSVRTANADRNDERAGLQRKHEGTLLERAERTVF